MFPSYTPPSATVFQIVLHVSVAYFVMGPAAAWLIDSWACRTDAPLPIPTNKTAIRVSRPCCGEHNGTSRKGREGARRVRAAGERCSIPGTGRLPANLPSTALPGCKIGDQIGDFEKLSEKIKVILEIWRTGRDSNPRTAINRYTLSRRAPSTARPPVRMSPRKGADYSGLRRDGKILAGKIFGDRPIPIPIPAGSPARTMQRADLRPALRIGDRCALAQSVPARPMPRSCSAATIEIV